MCSFLSTDLGRSKSKFASGDAPPDRQSVRPERRGDEGLAALLLAFFRKRLRSDGASPARSRRARLLMRRTLTRMARRHAAEGAAKAEAPPSSIRLKREEVMRTALMELRRLEEPAASPEETGLLVHRN